MSPRPPSEEIPPANLPACHVGLVYALAMEAGALEDRLQGVISIRGGKFTVRQGGLNGRGIVIMHAGIGRENAAEAAETLIAGHKPQWIISAGLAGGLNPAVKRGDIVVPDCILGEDGQRVAIDLPPSAQQQSATPGLHLGALLTVDRPVLKADQKRELGRRHGALAVDMETLAVAEVCQRQKQQFLAVRVINDAMDEELPADVERLLRKKTVARRIGAAAGSLLRRPSAVKDLWRMRETALVCSIRLAKYLITLIERLE